jgi:hypothetical protein
MVWRWKLHGTENTFDLGSDSKRINYPAYYLPTWVGKSCTIPSSWKSCLWLLLLMLVGPLLGYQPSARVVEWWGCYFVASGHFLCTDMVVITEQYKFWFTGVSCCTGITLHEGQNSIMIENPHFQSEGSTGIRNNGNVFFETSTEVH